MKRVINICLILTFLIGYLEWGKGDHIFLFQAEAEIFLKMKSDPLSVLHPFIIIPFCGQVMLLFTAFQQNPGRFLTFAGLACLSLFILFLFFIGIASLNLKILLSTLPFIFTGIIALRKNRRSSAGKTSGRGI